MNTKIASDGTAQKQPHCYSVDIHRHTHMTANRWRVRARDDDVAEIKSDRPIGAHTHTRSALAQCTVHTLRPIEKSNINNRNRGILTAFYAHTHSHLSSLTRNDHRIIDRLEIDACFAVDANQNRAIEPAKNKSKKRPHTTNHLSITFWKLHEHGREFDSPAKFQPVFHVKCQINTYTADNEQRTIRFIVPNPIRKSPKLHRNSISKFHAKIFRKNVLISFSFHSFRWVVILVKIEFLSSSIIVISYDEIT